MLTPAPLKKSLSGSIVNFNDFALHPLPVFQRLSLI